KLSLRPRSAEELVVPVNDPCHLCEEERRELVACCRRANNAIYVSRASLPADKTIPRRVGEQLGLRRLDGNLCADDDGITSLRVMSSGSRHEGYIPYSNRAINWHTDGYYNGPDQPIRAMLLHCVSDAASGGDNALLDHELAYALLRDESPELVAALMRPDAMTIPANIQDGEEIRPARRGPVFSVDSGTGALHMRYTARTRSIEWRDDPLTRAAVEFLAHLLEDGSEYVLRYRLQPGQGLVSNNTLHTRAAFQDDPSAGKSRLLYRARYYDRIAGTEQHDIE
nr:TauD/TfdA family dioxygenase [Gammaproteobacteria bacterium]NIR81669.1 TauD/TfdA family dioxygenase [Gammaproteobacteria bacterium]NIR88236.1 TauD/TfdA family dioxygenase [Gammaproteobacteria bacterium]NIU02775.1 TauD/TfdA family dioxygenase [Gammaproteobacteria bacterium]NIV73405.1 taurine catabolism dioxygenase TauD [Gammaproteobacteria bacterium]